ncbi:hypothetical protein F2P81_014404 [Scophthalmus maximus]|uniref:Uncharacterized protein n=1 Tax=Scophthalmus maximus TaxID=52904 RepID=A0A6A4SQF1_SCOMX|nr:hypothetical protein F2P81_014404 [Scophthalmus maximus]
MRSSGGRGQAGERDVAVTSGSGSRGTGSCRLNISRLSVTGVRRSVGVHVLHPPRQSDWTHGNRPAAAGTSPVKRVGRLEIRTWNPEELGSRRTWNPEEPGTRENWIQKNLDPEELGSRGTWNQKNLEPEELGSGGTSNQRNLDPEEPGTRENWIQKNLDPEEPGIQKN